MPTDQHERKRPATTAARVPSPLPTLVPWRVPAVPDAVLPGRLTI
ncbi:MAG TPA: hypothetical protein VF844_15940 [Ktedonobacteraceae bacterium]